MGNKKDEDRIQEGLIEQAYYDPEFDKDDRKNYYREKGRIRKERYLHQLENIQNMPDSNLLEICAKLRKYYGLAWRYKKNLLKYLQDWDQQLLQNFFNSGILQKWSNTVWLDREKLQEFEDFLKSLI